MATSRQKAERPIEYMSVKLSSRTKQVQIARTIVVPFGNVSKEPIVARERARRDGKTASRQPLQKGLAERLALQDYEITERDVDDAMSAFSMPGALCFVTGFRSNEGFALGVSFNSCCANTSNGSLTLALRNAVIAVTVPQNVDGPQWSPTLLDLVGKQTETLGNRHLVERALTRSETKEEAAEIKAGFSIKAVLGSIGFDGSYSDKSSGRRDAVAKVLDERSFTQTQNLIEIQRQHERNFSIFFSSHTGSDLVRMNPLTSYLPTIVVQEFMDFRIEDFTVDLLPGFSGDDLTHAYRIRSASGVWAQLDASDTRRVVGELLWEKFVRTLGDGQRAWPNTDRNKR
jgi:hypothetical protein